MCPALTGSAVSGRFAFRGRVGNGKQRLPAHASCSRHERGLLCDCGQKVYKLLMQVGRGSSLDSGGRWSWRVTLSGQNPRGPGGLLWRRRRRPSEQLPLPLSAPVLFGSLLSRSAPATWPAAHSGLGATAHLRGPRLRGLLPWRVQGAGCSQAPHCRARFCPLRPHQAPSAPIPVLPYFSPTLCYENLQTCRKV